MKLRLRVVAFAGAGLLSVAGAAAREKWIHAQTEHFEMFSCASEGTSREVLAKLEQFRATVLQIYPLRSNREPPTTIILFDSDRRFEPYRPVRHGEHEEAGGYCIHDPAEAVIVLSAEGDRDTTRGIIYHEYVHLLLAARGENPPTWLNEGLAQFFETFTITKNRFEIGGHNPALVETLRGESLMPLGHLFAVTNESSDYHEGSARNIFYAESWLLVHYAICGEDSKALAPALNRFVASLSAGNTPIDSAFQKSFGMDYETMQRQLQSYLHGGRYRGRAGPLVLGDLSAQIKFAPADDFDRDLALLDLRWRLQQPEDTTYRLRQLAQQRPESPRPYELLAIVASQGNEWEEGRTNWQRAAERGSKNAYAYLVLARDRLNQLLNGFSLDYRLPADRAATLRGWLDRALELSPDYADALEALALVEAMADKPRFGLVNHIQETVPKMRDKSLTLFALAVVHARVGHDDLARQIVELVLKSPRITPQVRMLAEHLSRHLAAPAAAAPSQAEGAGGR